MLTSVYFQFGRWFVILWAAEKGGDGTEKAWEWERRECQRKGWMPEKGGVSVKGGDDTEEGKSTGDSKLLFATYTMATYGRLLSTGNKLYRPVLGEKS
jgi:hypothetical protein